MSIPELPNIPPLLLGDEEATFDRLNQTVEDLQTLRHCIEQQGGMSKELAQGLESIAEGIVTTQLPLNAFTQLPSRTHYTATLEAVDVRGRSLLVQLLRAFWQLLKRVFQWIIGTTGETQKRAAAVKVMVARSRALVGSIDELEPKLSTVQVREKRSLLDSRVDDLLAKYNGLMADGVEQGPFHQTLKDLGPALQNVVRVLERKVELVVQATGRDGVGVRDNDTLSSLAELAEVRKPTVIPLLQASIKRLGRGYSTASLQECLEALKTHAEYLKERPGGKTTYDDLLKKVLGNKVNLAETYVRDPDGFSKQLIALQGKAAKLDRMAEHGKFHPELVEAARLAIGVLQAETLSLSAYVTSVVMMGSEYYDLATTFYQAHETHFKNILSLALASDDLELVASAQRILKALKAKVGDR